NDLDGFLYFTKGANLYRYDTRHPEQNNVVVATNTEIQSIVLLDSTVWVGANTGVASIRGDSLQWVYKIPYRKAKYGMKSISFDAEGHLWFGSTFQLYRLNLETQRVDSFPMLENADCRALSLIRGKLFVGTYGSGYFVRHQERFVRMPAGRNNELSHAHDFIQDENGYLWITTNRGLFKTHMDAVDAYLQDTTQQLDYYVYLEEDGIQNAEFNGGCSPAHLWLPDGRLSLPTIQGLVVFRPEDVPHFLPKDTVVIENIDVDGIKHQPGYTIQIPAAHSYIKVSFASAWWNHPYNQYVSYKLEGLHDRFQLCDIGQASYAIGHLKPGKYTLVFRRKCGFGSSDYVYSKQHFIVQTPWYAKSWAFVMYPICFLLAAWGFTVLYTRSIRQRNLELMQQVDKQTAQLRQANIKLESNFSKLAASEHNLRQNIRIRDRLISIITHDILTPLRFIGMIARMGAEDNTHDPEPAKKALIDVNNAARKLFHSTQNLLHWVNYQQEQFKTNPTNCSPFVLVEQLMEDFSEMSRFRGNTLINKVPEDDVIRIDPQILNIVLHNLLSNAIKFTQNGKIRVRSGLEHNWYLLEVSDTGRGMTAAQLESVRQGASKQSARPADDESAGNGIGLSLVVELVQALGGRWEIDSPEGEGVRVRIYLPLEQQASL
ncbi:MAG: ATP-binding protein, partial [Saprospiraceae bacterium]